ncbi:MAG: recombinase family protein [Clostridia bacterium]|nr:recombinase family protein [Clostridia bacterium]
MKYGYIRVSSKSQEQNTSLQSQREAVKTAGAEIIVEEIYTGGTVKDRPEFVKLISLLKEGDELIVVKLDRFARTVSEGSILAKQLYDSGITLNILNMGKIENSGIGALLLNVMLCFAQYEKDMINERCREGRIIARQNPKYRDGRPKKFHREQINLALSLLDEGKSYRTVSEMTGISKSTMIRAKKKITSDTEL